MYKNKYEVKHYTADELKQLFADAYGQKKVSRDNKEKLFN